MERTEKKTEQNQSGTSEIKKRRPGDKKILEKHLWKKLSLRLRIFLSYHHRMQMITAKQTNNGLEENAV